ncbi:GumC family protein [Brevundimonas sp. UBA5936]|uniref:GumC family protein n=1 Tax=Brevundimonas sp. UBA5936 TaxID=1946133 RepID=UPI0025B7B869|nr:polysaccharide biosynthesis tyrosine autokinase [Brevundimonas sp. UBA5936]
MTSMLPAAGTSSSAAESRPLFGQDGDGLIDLRRLWHILLKRWWILAGVLAVALVLGVVITLLSTPIYRASATLQIDREAAQVVDVEGVLPAEGMYSAQEFYQTQYGLLKSRSLAQRVVTGLRLAQDAQFIEANRRSPANAQPRSDEDGGSPAERNRQAVSQLLANLRVTPTMNSRLVTISYDSADPALAQAVVNSITETFIATNLERRFEASSYARRFLEERIEQLRVRLEESERELVAYASNQQIINIPSASATSDGGANRGRSLIASSLEALNASLAEARTTRIEAEERSRAAQASTGLGLSEVLSSPTIQALREQRAELTARRQELLERFQPEYPSVQQTQAQITELDRQLAAEAGDVRRSLQGQYASAAAAERSIQGEIDALKAQALDLDQRSIRYNILQRELDTNRTLYDGLLQRYREIGIAGGVGTNNVSVVDSADLPVNPVAPRPLINLALAGLLGLLLGAAIIFVLEFLDESLRVPADIEAKLNLPLLGSVPWLPSAAALAQAERDPRSGFSEAYHSVRSALQFARPGGMVRTLLVTSSQPAEGKSTSSVAIARAFARMGKSVLLIDGDLRNPSLHKMLGGNNRAGFSSALAGSDLNDLLQPTEQEHLTLLPSGPRPPSPADLLSSQALPDVLGRLAEHFDLVIIDGPPVMGLADATLLGNASEGVLFISGAGIVRRGTALRALDRLRGAGADILGGVLERFDSKRANLGGYGYEYTYAYDYGMEETPGAKARRRKR